MKKAKISMTEMEEGAERLRALAHPIRLGIIALLDQQGPLTVTEIHEALDIGQAVASHHLSIMKSKDILVSERDGKNSRYALRYECLNLVLVCMDRCRKDMKS